MSRRSLPKRRSVSGAAAIEAPGVDDERLDLGTIADIDPWKDIEKYDKQEAGQIQQVLVQFNDMVLTEKKNKRKSVGKSRVSTSSTRATGSKEGSEEASAKKEKRKSDKTQQCVSESSANDEIVAIPQSVSAEDSSGNENIEENAREEKEEKLEERREKSARGKNRVNRDGATDDKENKRKSVGKRRASTSSARATGGSNEETIQVASAGKEKMRRDKAELWISESIVNDADADVLENVYTGSGSDYENTEGKSVEKEEEKALEGKDKSFEAINDKKNTRKLVGTSRASTSSTKASSNEGNREKSTRMQKVRKEKIQEWINILENVPAENATDKNFVEEKETRLEVKEDKSTEAMNRGHRKSVEKEGALTSSMKGNSSSTPVEGQSVGKENIDKNNLNVNYEGDYERKKSLEKGKKCDEKLTETLGKTAGKASAQKCVVDDTSDGRREETKKSVFPLAPKNNQSRKVDASEFPSDEPTYDKKNCEWKKGDENLMKTTTSMTTTAPTTWIMKSRSTSADSDKGKIAVSNNNKYESRHARKRDEKMAKAFDKFGKQFVKYSNRVGQSMNNKNGPLDVSIDSESDSSSSDSSGSSSSSSSSSSHESSSSSSSSYSSSHCSCCCSSSSSYTTSNSDSMSTGSCSCPSCCEYSDLEYSEYTLASSSSTYPGSDDSTDSSTE